MTHKLRNTLFLFLITVLFFININVSLASDASPMAEYDLSLGGIQTFLIHSNDGSSHEVIIEEITSNTRIDSGTYKVTLNASSWTAGFYVVISNNQISRVHSPFYSVATGNISDAILTKNSTQKATYAFIYRAFILSYDTGVIATISNSKLQVSQR